MRPRLSSAPLAVEHRHAQALQLERRPAVEPLDDDLAVELASDAIRALAALPARVPEPQPEVELGAVHARIRYQPGRITSTEPCRRALREEP